MKLMIIPAILLLNDLSWAARVVSKTSVWPKNKVTLSDSYLPAVAQLLTYLLDKIDELDMPLDGPEVVQVVLLSPPSTTPSASTVISILNGTDLQGDTTTVKTVEVNSEDVLKEDIPGLKPLIPSPKPSLAEVVFGRLRDILAHEAKRQGFAKIQGYSRSVLDVLKDSSSGTSEEQLKTLIGLMLHNKNVKRRDSIAQSTLVLEGLNKKNSSLQKVLQNIPPLKFTL